MGDAFFIYVGLMTGKEACMKKFVSILLVMLLLGTSLSVSARVNTVQYAMECVQFLEKCGIVEKPFEKWDENSLITRKDAFVAVSETKDPFGYLDVIYDRDAEELKDIYDYDLRYEFSDIEYASEDYYLASVLVGQGLIRGSFNKEEADSVNARFYDNLTYGEALIILSRLFTYESAPYGFEPVILENYPSDTPYLDYFTDMRVVNSQIFSDSYCPQICAEDLEKPIPAYEFFTLLCRVMYEPAFAQGDYASPYKFYFVDYYLKNR